MSDSADPELTDFEELWIRACAVYPVLRWPLTCHLGRQLALRLQVPEPDLDGHVPVARHPWFRQGYIPEDRRQRLVEGLTRIQREMILDIYRALLDTDAARQEVGRQGFVPVDDPIFAQFMMAERPGKKERWANARIARRFGHDFVGALDVRMLAVAGGALALAAISGTAAAVLVWDSRVPGPETGLISLPVMVMLPAGTFMMGSPEREPGRDPDEGPQREVSIEAFAISRTEVTVAQFRDFETATGYRRTGSCVLWDPVANETQVEADRSLWPGFQQTDAHPVACVSWEDAQAYVAWANEVDPPGGYRLPSEAEWEYAARATSRSAYFWGETVEDSGDLSCGYANGADLFAQDAEVGADFWIHADCNDGGVYTVAVGSYIPNGFGLHDMSGNLWEWVEDCYVDTYEGAPTDGSPRRSQQYDTCLRVLRGGSWLNSPRNLRSARRGRDEPGGRIGGVGFRLARTR